jgi:hypothetical protein
MTSTAIVFQSEDVTCSMGHAEDLRTVKLDLGQRYEASENEFHTFPRLGQENPLLARPRGAEHCG